MGYRILVDENTSPLVVELLRDGGHQAIHVSRALEFGANDCSIADYARNNGFVAVTHDDDFLRPDVATEVPVLYYADDTVEPATLAGRIGELSRFVPDPSDLPGVTNLGDWN